MPDGTPKMHFEGFNFHLYLFRLVNVSSRSAMRLSAEIVGGFGFDDQIVDVSFDVAAYLLIEAHLDGPLVGRLGVLESEGHGGVAVRTEGCDE